MGASEAQYRLYGAPNGAFDNYFEEKKRHFDRGIEESRKKFFERTKSVKSMWHGEEAIRLARRALQKVESHVNREDVIQPLLTIEDMQLARFKMQLAILSHPEVHKRHKSTQVSAYGIEFEVHGVDRLKYIYDGVARFDKEGNESITKVLMVEGHDDHMAYTVDEQEAIMDTFDVLDQHDWEEDPTSQW